MIVHRKRPMIPRVGNLKKSILQQASHTNDNDRLSVLLNRLYLLATYQRERNVMNGMRRPDTPIVKPTLQEFKLKLNK